MTMSGYSLNMYLGVKKAASIREEYDYLTDDEFNETEFVKYKNNVYAMSDFMRNNDHPDSEFSKWDGYIADTYFSGVLVKYVEEDPDYVIFGTYFVS